MKRSTRTVVAVLTAAVALGVAAPAATAAAAHGPAVVKGKHDPTDKKLAQEQRQVLRDIAKKDEALARAVKDTRVSALGSIGGTDTKAAVLANVAADRAALADLATTVNAADSTVDLRQVRADLRDLRAENYVIVVNLLRQAAKIQAAADQLGGVADVTTAVDAAVAKALAVTAASDKSDFAAVRADLETAQEALDAAQGSGSDDPTEPTEPTEG